MKQYHLYLLKSLFIPVLSIAFTLTIIIWLSQSTKILALISNSGFGLVHFLELSSLLIPSLLLLIIPISTFTAILFIYHKSMNNSELIILKNAGLSNFQIALPALNLSLIMTIFCYVISLYLSPLSYTKYKDSLAYYRDNYAAIYLEEGAFNNIMKNITIYVDEYQDDGSLKGILVHDQRVKDHPSTIFAERGNISKFNDFARLELYNGNRQEIDQNGQLSILNFAHFIYDLSLKNHTKKIRQKELEEIKLSSLIKHKNIPQLRKKKISAEINQRLCWPLYNILLAIIALTTPLKNQFRRTRNAKSIVINCFFAMFSVLMYFISSNLATDNLLVNLLPFMLVIFFIAIFSYLLWAEKPYVAKNFIS